MNQKLFSARRRGGKHECFNSVTRMNRERCYIVRIYRRDEQDARSVVGLAQNVSSGRSDLFRSPDELWNIVVRSFERNGGPKTKSAAKRKKS